MAGVAGQDKLAGFFRFLKEKYGEHAPFDVRLVRTKAEFTPELVREAIDSGTAGFVVSIPDTEDAAGLLADVTAPTIVMDVSDKPFERRSKNLVFIRNDGVEIGRKAANYLIGQGVARSYAFLHAVAEDGAPCEWSRKRFAAFRDTLLDRGLWCDELTDLAAVAKLKRPAAVLAANDDCAFKLEEFLRTKRLRVPQDIAVLGVDNDKLLCENGHPRLSSVQPDFEEEGYLAAKLMDAMIRGEPPETNTLFVGVKTIVRRDSTAETSQAGKLVQKAVAFINRNALSGIDVSDVVEHLKCSRRLADLRFRQLQGRSMLDAITERRLDEVKRLLLATNDQIDMIATACGYKNTNYLKKLFRRKFSMTMSAFRCQGRAPLR